MKRKVSLSMALTVIILTLSLAVFPVGTVFADMADGTYDVPFELKEAGSDSTSIADGYFSKPAKLIVENGTSTVQLTITNSEWVKSLSGPQGAASVVSEDKSNDSRTVQMEVGDLSQPVTMNMHVVVPEEIAGMEYDNNHTVRGAFDVSGVPAKATPAQTNDEEKNADNQSEQPVAETTAEENPPTGDRTSIGLYVALLLSSVVVFAIYRLRFARN